MTARAAIIARIADVVQFVSGVAPDTIAHDKPLLGQAHIDSLDLAEIEFSVESEFAIAELGAGADASIDSIADAVIAAQGSAT